MISPLLTDLYQLTMAYGYWRQRLHEREAVFHLSFRHSPFGGHYAIAAGLATAVEFFKNWRFQKEDLTYLRSLKNPAGTPLFPAAFLSYLKKLRFRCDVHAVLEGTVVFPHEPLLRIQGPLLQAQLMESTLLNIINFQTLIATKAARVCRAAEGDTVLEFGMRRAQGVDGALSASRAAYIGGCHATSNVLAGKIYGIPVSGTHAHSWVTVFANEKQAFSAYAEVMPESGVFLVDTFDSVQGVKNAIAIGKQLRNKGFDLRGIRLDSGDLAALSIKARALLDAAGFPNAQIIASNCLDEYVITRLKKQGAKICCWGVGTHLVTAYDEPALDGVYKLSALRDEQGEWQYKLKLSEQTVKISHPGIQQVRRFFWDDAPVMDIVYDLVCGIPEEKPELVSMDATVQQKLPDYDACMDLLQPIFVKGKCIFKNESLAVIRERALQQVSQFLQPPYLVGLEGNLFALKKRLIDNVKKNS